MKRYIKNIEITSRVSPYVVTKPDVNSLSLEKLLDIKHAYTKSDGVFGSFQGHEEVEYFMSAVVRLEEEFGYEI